MFISMLCLRLCCIVGSDHHILHRISLLFSRPVGFPISMIVSNTSHSSITHRTSKVPSYPSSSHGQLIFFSYNHSCFGSYQFHLDYYMSHAQTGALAAWQEPGLNLLSQTPANTRKPILMDEFNSASCGGVPESNMFGVGLWSADYALQMASVGYSGAYLHTREHGVTYKVFDPPAGPAGAAGTWTTNPNFYAMLAVTEALQNSNGSRVVDLNLENSVSDYSAVAAGYAVYDASSPSNVHSLVLFNYANASAQGSDYTLPASFFAGSGGNVLVRYMTAPSATETTNISWGNQTYGGVADGVPVPIKSQWDDQTVSCSSGCTVQVPGPGMAVVFVQAAPQTTAATNSSSATQSGSQSGSAASPSNTGDSSKSGSWRVESRFAWAIAAAAIVAFGASV